MKREDPWNLTERQQQVLAALAEIGCRKALADQDGVSQQAVCNVVRSAVRRMKVKTDMQAVVTFDRWARKV